MASEGRPLTALAPIGSGGADPELVERVKALCRSDTVAKGLWCAWCDASVGGTKDPTRMDTETLQLFFQEYEAGTITVASPLATGASRPGTKALPQQPELAEMVKVGQRASNSWKNAWVLYCKLKGNAIYDPLKHSEEFLKAFFEFLGAQGAIALQDTSTRLVLPQVGAPPLKRPCLGAERPLGLSDLAEEVKRLQRVDPLRKQQWSDFCDVHGGGVKDPMRHTPESLQSFLQQCTDTA